VPNVEGVAVQLSFQWTLASQSPCLRMLQYVHVIIYANMHVTDNASASLDRSTLCYHKFIVNMRSHFEDQSILILSLIQLCGMLTSSAGVELPHCHITTGLC